MSHWHHPKLDPTAKDKDLISNWAGECRLSGSELGHLTDGETGEVIECLRSLAGWWSGSAGADHDNPFWFDDEGYRDAESDTRKLQLIARELRLRNFDSGGRHGPIRVDEIISIGRAGAARAALDLAIAKRIPYGGWCNLGRVSDGEAIPASYHLRETKTTELRVAIKLNMKDGDATLILSLKDQIPPGISENAQWHFFKVARVFQSDLEPQKQMDWFRRWLVEFDVKTLHVMGSLPSDEPGIVEFTWCFLDSCVEAEIPQPPPPLACQ